MYSRKLRIQSWPAFLGLTLAVAVFGGALATGHSLSVNTSVSMPRGLYALAPVDLDKLARGDIVSVCIPDLKLAELYRARKYLVPSSACPGGVAGEMKPVVGLAGDVVSISARGTSVNGTLISRSLVYDTDSQGLPIGHLALGWTRKLAPGEVFVLANYIDRSLDSRYYGVARSGDIRGVVHPLITE